ncbi:MAG TPA: 2-oxoglutarate dehydrogenase complex dihydrolipoyllysine-residue succinyltransferase [Gemmataceae bacterium]|nr:2-oxoglutarate dehydrogenase complex dihydrolipoyllysine-residue succinyltransferase [Gemmataceae bacterium]
MAIEIKVPSVGESITEGSIARWIKKNGDLVRVDEPIFELETEKASTEVPAPASGKLTVKTPEGTKVTIGAVVGSIEPADVPAAAPSAPAPTKDGNGPAPSPAPAKQPAQLAAASALSPSAARLANEEGIDPSRVAGTGKRGMVLKEDVQKAVDDSKTSRSIAVPTPSPTPSTPPIPAGQRESRQRMSVIRQRIAQRLLQSQQTTASLTTFNEVDMSAIMDLRARYKDKFKEKSGVGLGFMSFFVKAAIEALKAYPVVNARIDENDIVYQNFWNVGVAVSTEKGLMVPVLHDADHLGFADIEKAIAAAVVRAREGKITPQDLTGGTFTITNGGTFGSMMSTPILNPPQSAILGMHAIQKRAMVKDDQIVIRPMMYVALTYDHRLIDGREAVLFRVRVKECIENPERLLLEV